MTGREKGRYKDRPFQFSYIDLPQGARQSLVNVPQLGGVRYSVM